MFPAARARWGFGGRFVRTPGSARIGLAGVVGSGSASAAARRRIATGCTAAAAATATAGATLPPPVTGGGASTAPDSFTTKCSVPAADARSGPPCVSFTRSAPPAGDARRIAVRSRCHVHEHMVGVAGLGHVVFGAGDCRARRVALAEQHDLVANGAHVDADDVARAHVAILGRKPNVRGCFRRHQSRSAIAARRLRAACASRRAQLPGRLTVFMLSCRGKRKRMLPVPAGELTS